MVTTVHSHSNDKWFLVLSNESTVQTDAILPMFETYAYSTLILQTYNKSSNFQFYVASIIPSRYDLIWLGKDQIWILGKDPIQTFLSHLSIHQYIVNG